MSVDDAEAFLESVPLPFEPLKLGDTMLVVAHTEGERATNTGPSLIETLRKADFAEADRTRLLVTNVHAGDVLLLACVDVDDEQEDEEVADRVLRDAISVDFEWSRALVDPEATRLELVAAYERKEIGDLVSSIMSRSTEVARARWPDQKLRLQNLCRSTGAKPFLIIEGYVQGVDRRWRAHMNDRHLQSMLASVQFRDGITVLQADSTADTALQLLLDARYARNERVRVSGWTRLGAPGEREAFVVRKADRDTPESWFVGALSMVARVTEESAKAIAAAYPSPRALVEAYEAAATPRARDALLAKIRFTPSRSSKERNIGPAISLDVRKRFYPDIEASSSSSSSKKKRASAVSDVDDDDDDDAGTSSSEEPLDPPPRKIPRRAKTLAAESMPTTRVDDEDDSSDSEFTS